MTAHAIVGPHGSWHYLSVQADERFNLQLGRLGIRSSKDLHIHRFLPMTVAASIGTIDRSVGHDGYSCTNPLELKLDQLA